MRTFASREIEEENSIVVDTKQNSVSSSRGIPGKVVDSVRIWFEGMAVCWGNFSSTKSVVDEFREGKRTHFVR